MVTTHKRATPIERGPGGAGATFVAWELMYDYLMWVSPTFMLKVIRVFIQTGQPVRFS